MSAYKYILLLLVAIISFGVSRLFISEDFLKIFLAAPGVLGLFAVLYFVYQDWCSTRRSQEKQDEANAFTIGAVSHFAITAFDRHVNFAEEYMAKLEEGLDILGRDGPNKSTLTVACDLTRVRRKYTLWITPDVEKTLVDFEHMLTTIGANAHFIDSVPVSKERSAVVDEMYNLFKQVKGSGEDEGNSVRVIQFMRKVLGVQEFTKLREIYLHAAVKARGTGNP